MSSLVARRIIVTRPADRAGSLLDRIRAAGAIAVHYPTIVTVPPETWTALDAALGSLQRHDWLVFTSAAGVRATFERALEIGIVPQAWGAVRIAAVGPATAAAVQAFGRAANAVPEQAMASAIADAIPDAEGMRFLVVRGNLSRDDAADAIRARGGIVEAAQAYTTSLRQEVDAAAGDLLQECDAITFTSPSTLRGFLNALGPRVWPPRAAIVTIGPSTSAAVRAAGLAIGAEAAEHTEAGLVIALAGVFSAEPDGALE